MKAYGLTMLNLTNSLHKKKRTEVRLTKTSILKKRNVCNSLL